MRKTLRADLLLLLVTLIWGATFSLIKASLQSISPFDLVSMRFLVAGIFLFFCVCLVLKKTNRNVLVAGFILGVLNAGLYLMQTFGMRHVDAATSAFISAIGVIFVPFLAPLFGLARVRFIEILGSLICLFGLYILIGARVNSFSIDQLFILLSTFCWAISICYLQKISPAIKTPALLAFYQVIFILPFSFMLSVAYPAPIHWASPMLLFTIFYTGIFATGIVFLIQVRYQKETTATHAAIIYSFEPLIASIVAIYVNHQPLTDQVIKGGAIILLSIILIEVFPRIPLKWKKKKRPWSNHDKT